jgi:hypothetical protein
MRMSVPLKTVRSRSHSRRTRLTSRRCFTFFTNILPSAAKPFTASTALSVLDHDALLAPQDWAERADAQFEDLGCISRLDVVPFALTGITSDDGEVSTGDGEDGTAILCVGVERLLMGLLSCQ